MAKSYFTILGVSTAASPEEIRTAYRRLAKAFHPDHYAGDSGPFREIQEAYSVLGDPAKRSSYSQSIEGIRSAAADRPAGRANRPAAEPLIPEQRPLDLREISLARSFATFSPSVEEMFDWIWNDFSGRHRPKSGRVQELLLEVPLTREQARRGGPVAVLVPARTVCPDCRGTGVGNWFVCRRCDGEGCLAGEIPVSIDLPAGLQADHAVVVPLDRFGLRHLHMTVLFRPIDAD